MPAWVLRIWDDGDSVPIRQVMGGRGAKARREYKSRAGGVICREVCEACNNGWMSDLETRAKPVLEPLVVGQPRRLPRSSQEALAAWAIKTVFVLSLTHPDAGRVPDPVARAFGDSKVPSDTERVWIGAYSRASPGVEFQWRGIEIDFRERGGFSSPGFVALLRVGAALFRCTGHQSTADSHVRPVGRDVGWQRIWPTVPPAQWPPSVLLGDAAVDRLFDPGVGNLDRPGR